MNMNMIYKLVYFSLLLLLFSSCGSAKFVPTTDVCSLEKHWEDSLYQVKINDKEISDHWYLKSDALEITHNLAKNNKCMSH